MIENAREIIVYLWLAVGAVYLLTAFRVKPMARIPNSGQRKRVVLILTELLVLSFGAGLLFSESPHLALLNSRFLPAVPGIIGLGIALTAAGCTFSSVARLSLGQNWSATATIKQDHELVHSGPYRLVRHPIYTGCLIAALGTAIAFGETRDLLALPIIVVGFWLKLHSEERLLTSKFGDRYAAYRREVRGAIIPYIL